MAKLNTKTLTRAPSKVALQEKTTNYHGEVAYTLKDKTRLIERVVGAFWNEKLFYQSGKKTSEDIRNDIRAVASSDPKFVLQLAAWARNDLYLRTTPQVLLVEAANIEACKPFVREYTPKIVKRADELADVIAYQLSQFGKPIPNSLKKGLSAAFANFDEYQLNKYDSDKGSVSLGDVLKLIYRKTNYPVSKALYNYLVNDEVDADALPKIGALKALLAKDKIDEEALELIRKSSVTWETLISKFGSTKENWQLVAPNMGYMAKLRNLRNFVEKGVDLDPILEEIANPEKVKRSKQLPFRFLSAFREVNNQKAQRAIAKAFEASVSNVELPGDTAILVDHSASMDSPLSDKSKVTYFEVGAVLGAIAVKKSANSTVVTFGNTAMKVAVNPDDTMMTNIDKIRNAYVGHSTEAWRAFDLIKNERFDRIFLISDMQCYNTSGSWGGPNVEKQWTEYVKKNPKARLYSWDVSSYGTAQTPSDAKGAMTINGWSDKIIDYINLTSDKDAIEREIKKY